MFFPVPAPSPPLPAYALPEILNPRWFSDPHHPTPSTSRFFFFRLKPLPEQPPPHFGVFSQPQPECRFFTRFSSDRVVSGSSKPAGALNCSWFLPFLTHTVLILLAPHCGFLSYNKHLMRRIVTFSDVSTRRPCTLPTHRRLLAFCPLWIPPVMVPKEFFSFVTPTPPLILIFPGLLSCRFPPLPPFTTTPVAKLVFCPPPTPA